MKEELLLNRTYKHFIYRLTIQEDLVTVGDYIYDFVSGNLGRDPIVRCDSERFAELINVEHKKPLYQRRSAKIIASNDPVLNINGVSDL